MVDLPLPDTPITTITVGSMRTVCATFLGDPERVVVDWRTMIAARNNADRCDAVCRTHEIASAIGDGLWAPPARTPRPSPGAGVTSTTPKDWSLSTEITLIA